MKKTLFLALATCLMQFASAQGIYQFADPGFEQYTTSGKEPGNGWNSFNSATGTMAGLGKGSAPKPQHVTPGANGTSHAVQIFSNSILGKKANGNLTTGMINMGSMTPADAANHNYTKRDDASHSLRFAGRPDAVTFWARFKSGGSPNGRGQFILHDGDVDYRDPEVSNQEGNRIGKASVLIPASTEWVQYTGEFTYDKAQTDVQYLLASFTTNPTPGGSKKDYLDIDEVYFIYYHALSSLTYDGQTIDLAAAESASGVSLPQSYDPTKLSYTVKGAGASVELSYEEIFGTLNITVKGNDYSVNPDSKTVYTLFFNNTPVDPNPDPDPDPDPNPDPNPDPDPDPDPEVPADTTKALGPPIQSLAELDNGKTYVLYNPTFTAYAVSRPEKSATNIWAANMIDGDNSHRVSDASYSEPLDTCSANSSWMIVPFNGKYYVYNMGAKGFLQTPNPKKNDSAACTFTQNVQGLSITDLGSGRFALNGTTNSQGFMCASPQLSYPIGTWTSSDSGSAWQICENPNVEASVDVLMLIDPSLVPTDPYGEAVASLSELNAETTYALYNPNFKGYAIYSAEHTGSQGYIWAAGVESNNVANSSYSEPIARTDAAGAWMVMEVGGLYYIYNMEAQQYLTTPGYVDATAPCLFSTEPVGMTVSEISAATFTLTKTGEELDYFCLAPQLSTSPLSIWRSDDAGCAWQFLPNPNVAANPDVLNDILVFTGISATATTQQPAAIYSISGRAMGTDRSRLPQGIYIQRGRKFIVR